MNKLKRIPIILLPLSVIMTAIVVVVTITFGWYTTIKKTGHIDANTKNAGFYYKINSETLETDEYYISNLVFFDIDSIYEGRHFSTMVYEIELSIENVTDTAMGYTVTFEGDKRFLEDASENTTSISYVACVMSPEKLGYQLTSDNEVIANKAYYSYDENSHTYESETLSAGEEILPTDGLYDYNPQYVPATYLKTKDSVVKPNKTYYEHVSGTNYKPTVTRGNAVRNEENVFYEEKYISASGTAYNSSKDYFNKITSTSGEFYIKMNSADVNSTNYINYYLETGTYQVTTDTLFQNETYYLDSSGGTALTTLTPGTNSMINDLYEKGSKVNSLIVNTPEIVSYTPNYGTSDSFVAEYLDGHLDKKGDTYDTQNVYLYVFGVQEIDTAKNDDFIELIHTFKIMISAKTDSSWDVTENTENNG